MRNARLLTIVTVALFILLYQGGKAHSESMGTAFTYQGRLIDANEPADGDYDLEFQLYDGPSGNKSVYSYLMSGLSGYQHANVSQNFWTENSVSTTCDYVTLWISGDGYTVSSRYFWRILLVITDGNDTESEILRCDCWGLNEGCNPNHYDYYDETKTGADGRTWKRYTREIPGNLDKSKLTIKIVHNQASWDWTSASSWFRLDNVCFSDSQGNICQFIENGNFEKDPVGTSFGDISDWEHSSADVHIGNYDENLEIVDDYYCDIRNQIANAITIDELNVINGYFTVKLDFGSDVFNGNARWLEIGVRPGEMNDPNGYTSLSPRQQVIPTPYALYAKNSGIQDVIVRGFEVANTADDDTTVTIKPGAAYHGTRAVTKTANITLTFATAGDWYDGATHSYSGGAGWCYIGYDSSGNIKLLANNPPDVDDSFGNNASGATKYYFDDSKGTSGEYWRVIGAVYIDTDNQIHSNYVTYQVGAWIYYDARQSIALGDTSWTDIDCSPIVPSISQLIMFQLDASSRSQVYLRPNGSSNDSGTLYFLNSSTAVHPAQMLTLDSSQLCEGKVNLGSGYATLEIVAYYMHIR